MTACTTDACAVSTPSQANDQAVPVRSVRPRADVSETNDHWVLTLDVPGVRSEDVSIEIERGVLRIDATSSWTAPEGLKARSLGFGQRRYQRAFSVGNQIDRSAISASASNGVLQITLPKAAEQRAQRIDVS